jgi:hypothetical protein
MFEIVKKCGLAVRGGCRTPFALAPVRMNWFQIYLKVIVRRAWGVHNEKAEERTFCSHLDSAENLEPHPNAECDKPSRFHSLWSAAIRSSIYRKLILPCLENNMKKMSILKTFAVLACLTLTSSVMAFQNNSQKQPERGE